MNEQRNCEIRRGVAVLDYEQQQRHLLTIKLNARRGVTDESRLLAQLDVIVLDQNDNPPTFVVSDRLTQLTTTSSVTTSGSVDFIDQTMFDPETGLSTASHSVRSFSESGVIKEQLPTYVVAISEDAPIDSPVLQLQAKGIDIDRHAIVTIFIIR